MADQTRESIESRLAELRERRDYILNNPLRYASERIQQVDRALKGRPGGPGSIKPRQARPGNVSMHDHLQRIKAEYAEERKAGGRVDQDADRVGRSIEDLEARLAESEDDDGS